MTEYTSSMGKYKNSASVKLCSLETVMFSHVQNCNIKYVSFGQVNRVVLKDYKVSLFTIQIKFRILDQT